METKDVVAIIISAIGVVAAITTVALKALFEYRKQGVAQRAEMCLKMRSRLREDPSFKNICHLLQAYDNAGLGAIASEDRGRFMGFFEEVALMRNSGLINDTVTYYMFGHFAMRCLECDAFFNGIDRSEPLLSLFMDFANEMMEKKTTFKYDRKDFIL